MDPNFGFGRLARLGAGSMWFSAPAISTALAEELYAPRRPSLCALRRDARRAPPVEAREPAVAI